MRPRRHKRRGQTWRSGGVVIGAFLSLAVMLPAWSQPAPFPKGKSIEVRGRTPDDRRVTGSGMRLGNGRIGLADKTTPSYRRRNGAGGIYTYDALRIFDDYELPGELVSSARRRIANRDAIGAHVYSRYVYDYYRNFHGRNSWDGKGRALVSVVRYGGGDFCNAFFDGYSKPAMMVYGKGCDFGGGKMMSTLVDIDLAGHEITHGVIDSTAGLVYAGQSGALNESFSDYFGNVIGNRYKRKEGADLFEGACRGVEPSFFCVRTPEGNLAMRYMLNGNTFRDYIRLLDPPPLLKAGYGVGQDHGGVHLNSAIWNHALWSIRNQLAAMDGMRANRSPRAQEFDRIVYAALTRYLTPTSGFFDARAAVEAAARDLGADTPTLRVIKQQMDFSKLCQGCVKGASPSVTPVETSGAAQKLPAVSGRRVAWLEYSGPYLFLGRGYQGVTGTRSNQPLPSGQTFYIGFAGKDALITGEVATPVELGKVKVVRHDLARGRQRTLAKGFDIFDVAGSDRGAFVLKTDGTLTFYDTGGRPTTSRLRFRLFGRQEAISSMATGGRTAVFGGTDGTVVVWRVGDKPRKLDAKAKGTVLWSAASETHVATASVNVNRLYGGGAEVPTTITLFDLDRGTKRIVSRNSSPFGLTMSKDYVVWPEITGTLGGGVAAEAAARGMTFADTDLYLHGIASGDNYRILKQRGQQGFPAISGRRLVWQDSVLGGDDIFSSVVPKGL